MNACKSNGRDASLPGMFLVFAAPKLRAHTGTKQACKPGMQAAGRAAIVLLRARARRLPQQRRPSRRQRRREGAEPQRRAGDVAALPQAMLLLHSLQPPEAGPGICAAASRPGASGADRVHGSAGQPRQPQTGTDMRVVPQLSVQGCGRCSQVSQGWLFPMATAICFLERVRGPWQALHHPA